MLEGLFALLLSLREIKDGELLQFLYSTEQGYDRSCGLSTLACLISIYWNGEATEMGLAGKHLLPKITAGDLRVSLADMLRILEAEGFLAKAYQMSLEQLRKAEERYAPIIVHYDRPEGHFALLLGMAGDLVVTADPAAGTTARERSYFESRWSGYVILVSKKGEKADEVVVERALKTVLGRRSLLEGAARAWTTRGTQ